MQPVFFVQNFLKKDLTSGSWCGIMSGPRAVAAGQIFHYNTVWQKSQAICPKKLYKIYSHNLCNLYIEICKKFCYNYLCQEDRKGKSSYRKNKNNKKTS